MSWCGGGLIRPTPGVECRTRAMLASTLWPGSWPPSPGLAPWAILIWMSSALTRYSAVTPLPPPGVVQPPADPVHGDRQGGVRLAADRAEGHGPGGEALDDVRRRF